MATAKILLVEDEPIVAKDIALCLKNLGHQLVATIGEGEKALNIIQEMDPDLVIMDITLTGKMDGIDVANLMKEQNLNIPVIFLTASTDKKTFDKASLSEPYGYLVKPFKELDLYSAIEIARQKFTTRAIGLGAKKELLYSIPDVKKTDDVLFVKSNYTLVKVNMNELIYVEALKDYVIFHTKSNRYVVHSTMKKMESRLSSKDFIRVHRSFIVRLEDVNSVTPHNLVLESMNKEIPVGGSYKDKLMKSLKRW